MEVPNLAKSGPKIAQPRTSDGISALGTAVYEDYLEIVKLLLKHGAHVNDEDGSWDVIISFFVLWQRKLVFGPSPKECVHRGSW